MKFLKILKQLIKESENTIDSESDMEEILTRCPKVTEVLVKLLTDQKGVTDKAKDQLRKIVTDIKAISLKPTTFRIVLSNGSYFGLKYDPSPLQLKYPDKFEDQDAFVVIISGKRYNIDSRSEFEQALDYLNKLMSTQPVSQGKQGETPAPGEEDNDDETQPEEPADDEEES